MEERDQILIQQYLSQELSPAERSQIEERIQQDSNFRKEMEAYKMAVASLKLAQRDELKERFKRRDQVLDRQIVHTKGRNGRLWLFIAIAGIIILVGWQFFYNKSRSNTVIAPFRTDSIQVDQPLPVQQDTMPVKEVPNYDRAENKSQEETENGPELYAANFEPYKDDSMDPTSRSDEEGLSPVEKFQAQYWEGNYKDAATTFNELEDAQKQNDNLRFIYANALMAEGKTKEPAAILMQIVRNSKSIYRVEASFYLALCYTKNGDTDSAKRLLDTYLADPDAAQKQKAKKILGDLN
jgi:hypothetical protein